MEAFSISRKNKNATPSPLKLKMRLVQTAPAKHGPGLLTPRKNAYDINFTPPRNKGIGSTGQNVGFVGAGNGVGNGNDVGNGNGVVSGTGTPNKDKIDDENAELTREAFEGLIGCKVGESGIKYILVKKEDWEKIPHNSHIRWIDTQGNFRRGSFLLTFWSAQKNNRRYMRCQNITGAKLKILKKKIPGFKNAQFSIPLDTISMIYKKVDDSCIMEVEYMNERIKKLEETVAKMTNIIHAIVEKR